MQISQYSVSVYESLTLNANPYVTVYVVTYQIYIIINIILYIENDGASSLYSHNLQTDFLLQHLSFNKRHLEKLICMIIMFKDKLCTSRTRNFNVKPPTVQN